ncbi:Variant surface glycoprotein [Trypanosoma congolense IL3000]|uniref:Variant surface glycoprotein n=1 Tax=Trypanosoma congolense (strain IL3000) TaxID=1068625 RepID=F9WAF2_TRYCI|nr:Variant surface glycoprotein [Trypanosoma congolense IL3000]
MLIKLIREVKNRGLFVNVLLATVVICSWCGYAVGQPGAEVKATDNAEQFALLCRIYNVAKNPPIHHVDLQDPLKIVKEIDVINASLVDPKWLNETDQVENSSGVQLQPTTTREAAVAQALIRRITKKAHNILEEIGNVNTTRDIEKVKSEFDQVIFGEAGSKVGLCHGALKGVGERGNACGISGLQKKGQSAGKNLVVDFFCLCAQRNNEGIQDSCKVKVGSKSDEHSWGSGAPSGSSSMWASIKKECGNLLHQNPKSTKEGHEVLADFFKHLKSGGLHRWGNTKSILGSGRKAGMLGTSAGTEQEKGGDILCDGSKGYAQRNSGKPPGGICVFYGEESEWDNIDWVNKFKNALATLKSTNNKTATIQRDIQKLQMLLHRAEQIYETAKVITEIQNPVVPTNLQTASKRLTAYNAAKRHNPYAHFILLFVLL